MGTADGHHRAYPARPFRFRRYTSDLLLFQAFRGTSKPTHSSGQNTYFHLNHPIRWVRLVGLIVALDVYPNRLTMTLDDSSGLTIDVFCRKATSAAAAPAVSNTTVECSAAITHNHDAKPAHGDLIFTTNEGYKVDLEGFDIGSVVKVKGGISEFRGEKQITLERISLVRTTNEEASGWTENAAFHRDILSQPWVVSESDQQQARIEAEGVEREREAKKERKRKHKAMEEKRKKVKKGKKKLERKREAKSRAPQYREGKKNSVRPEVERKRDSNDGDTVAARKQDVGKPARPHRDAAAATGQPVRRPVVAGNFEALGL
ncbi:MAG: hypothetical protein Q9197_004282 [Variospora fuerteventurae]